MHLNSFLCLKYQLGLKLSDTYQPFQISPQSYQQQVFGPKGNLALSRDRINFPQQVDRQCCSHDTAKTTQDRWNNPSPVRPDNRENCLSVHSYTL
jgi:hypothetical protein